MGAPDYQSAFRRYLTRDEPDDQGEIRAFCPVHEDPDSSRTPSASFNFALGYWHCMGCSKGGMIEDLYRQKRRERRRIKEGGVLPGDGANVVSLSTRRRGDGTSDGAGTTVKPLPTEEELTAAHERLLKQPRLLSVMTEERGLRVETLKEFRIGHDTFRYTIPVYDADGVLVNVRRYNPKARRAQDKMLNITGHGSARIFRPDLLAKYEEVIVSEGEMDMLVAHQMGLPVITHTAGAGTFKNAWGPLFAGKAVFFCYDDDEAGYSGSVKAAKVVAPHAEAVYIMRLNTGIKGGDITDFFIKMGNGLEEFRAVQEEARKSPWGRARTVEAAPSRGKRVSLEESMSTTHGGEALEMAVQIAGKQNPPYVLPKRFRAVCDQDKGNVCAVCPMSAWNGDHVDEITANDEQLLEFVDANDKIKTGALRRIIGAKCWDHITYSIEEAWSVEELLVTNSIDHRGDEDQAPVNRRVLNVGTYRTPINTTARIVGKQVADPKTQRGVFQSWLLEQTQTNLDKFRMTEKIFKGLRRFQPAPGQTPLDKCYEIAEDLAANVTKIYGRPELHVAYDLVWHSVLGFNFSGVRVEKGWLECLVMGDTRTGKSEAALQLSRHYNAGVLKSCEGATFAGIVGGVQQMGSRWMVTWGIIPLQDRRLVVLDEVSGLKDKDVIENMSSIRSSGKAQLTKIATEETSARTRLIWISNPADGRRLHDNAGSAMYAIAKLVPNPEDIARFDFALAAAGDEVAASLINTNRPPQVRHRYISPNCQALVLWAWSRTADQVVWESGVEEHVVLTAVETGARYVSEPPLVQVENIRMKLARIAVAIAARTFSTNEEERDGQAPGELVVVRKEHVDSAVAFLDAVYGTEAMGYLRHSRRTLTQRRIAQERKDQVRRYLKESPQALNGLLAIGDSTFKPRDFVDFAGMESFEAQSLVQDLLKWKMIRRLSRGSIRMEPALIEILKEFEDAMDEEDL